jgi:hypothetical protein
MRPLRIITLLAVAFVAASVQRQAALGATFTHPAEGYTVAVPDGWHVDEKLLELDGPLILSNVAPEEYLHGGLLPPGGADITIRVVADTDETKALGSLRKDQKVDSSDIDVGGRKVPEITYGFDVGKPYTKVATAFKIEGRVFLFQLVYADEGANPKEFRKTFHEVVRSVRGKGGKK